ncbi:MAG: MFS transporter [Clostridiales bacterium]|jgi:Na+/melibiose symporter-like transporter|nr:MFS transporter [Clostridiales bacterium]
MKPKADSSHYRTKLSERVLYGIYGVGLSIFFVVISMFLQQYYVTNMAVPPAMIAIVFLIGKIWDAINDPLFGVIVDKAPLKGGKYLPWMRIATFLLPFTVILLFFVPASFSAIAKSAYLLVAYILFDAACTMTEVPYFAITTAMTDLPKERSLVISISKFIGTSLAVVVLFIPAMYGSIGWKPTMAIFAFLAMATMLPGCFAIKERFNSSQGESPSMTSILKYIKGNKYLQIFFLSAIFYGITNTPGGVGNFLAIYMLGGDAMIVPLILVSFVPGLLAIVIVQSLLGKFDKVHIKLVTLAVTGLTSAIMYFTGYENMPLMLILSAIRGFSAGAHTMLFFLFAPDCAEYGAYSSGIHAEGATFAIQSFASKMISAIAGSVGLLLLGWFGFKEGLGVVQSDSAKHGIWILYTIFPVIGIIIQAFILKFFYKLRDKDVAVMGKANTGEITRAEAEALLGGKER